MQISNVLILCALLPSMGLAAPAPAAGGALAKVKAAAAKAAAGAAGAAGAAAGGAASGGAASGGAASNGNARNGTATAGGNASNNGTAPATGNNNNAGNRNGNAANPATTAAPNAANGGTRAQNAAQSSTSSVVANQASAQAVINPKMNGGMPPIDVTIAKESVGAAVNGWQADTGMVSNWLNTATSLSGTAFTQGATIAYNAEVNELNHKAVLDKNLPQQAIASANDTLAAQGSFQAVVDSLQAMISEGPGTAQARVAEINNNRCVNVLPNINTYFSVAGSPQSTASVPTGCAAVAATNSGSVIPTEAPGSIGGNGTPPQNGPAQNGAAPTPAAGNNNNNNNNNNGGANAQAASASSSTSSNNGANGARPTQGN